MSAAPDSTDDAEDADGAVVVYCGEDRRDRDTKLAGVRAPDHDRLFPGLEPMTSWSQGNSFTAAPGLPFSDTAVIFEKKITRAQE
jgi:hypothetical protein